MSTARGRVVFDGVWKKFHRGQLHDSLRDLIPAMARRMTGRGPDRSQLEEGDFWAVKDVSFEVSPGEALGIIGPNGAGKSTILKLLSGILRPNRGTYLVEGRIGALIEVAAGFHPDLTGRENIFLQGSIMGMRKREIETRFDEIVEFAGLPEFIDTQVKRYSTGMNARLGFSIAAHLNPDVLLIDEVLAVGDYAFQKRAFERISTMVRREIPVVIVSHQLDRIAQLCTNAVLLDRGTVAFEGSATQAITNYVRDRVEADVSVQGDAPIRIESLEVEPTEAVRSGGTVRLCVQGHASENPTLSGMSIGLRVRASHTGEIIFATGTERGLPGLQLRGAFALSIDLDMNVPGGVYAVESVVWDHRREQDVALGPATYVRVEEDFGFWGKVNLSPRMQLLTLDSSGHAS
jgi:ABC-type polysaccharide/polyol phosphate transport system ATPase subunit